jgi:hypothetical protein
MMKNLYMKRKSWNIGNKENNISEYELMFD